MKHHDIASLRRAIASLARTKQRRRYPAGLRAELGALVEAHPELDIGALARELDMPPQTLKRLVRPPPPVLPVRVVAHPKTATRSTVVVHGPCGLVVDGLDVTGLAELIRALS